ncbi:MAG: hypothetical protein JHD28_00955 [Bacteroidia bacterium]|nr:hypothetical protein [Bacteroidia bacterium]
MENNSLITWEEYWNLFDRFISLLEEDNKNSLVFELKDAQKFVNGLTDGWFEFKFAFEKIMNINKQNMTKEQIDIANSLLNLLNNYLKNR